MPAPPYTVRNHYIPASVTGAFADAVAEKGREGKVLWGRKGVGLQSPQRAETLFFEKHLYTLREYPEKWKTGLMVFLVNTYLNPKGNVGIDPRMPRHELEALAEEHSPGGSLRADIVERHLERFLDTPFADAAESIRSGRKPTREEDRICRSYLSLLQFRGPAWLRSDEVREMVRTGLAEGTRQTAFLERWDGPESAEVKAAFDEVFTDIAHVLEVAIRLQQDVMLNSAKCTLQVLVAEGPTEFVLGDNPGRIYLTSHDPRVALAYTPGLRHKNAVITCPIGPRHCLVTAYRPGGRPFASKRITDEMVRSINTAQLTYASDVVVFPRGRTDVFMPGASLSPSPESTARPPIRR